MKTILFFLFVVTSIGYSDDIFLKSGTVIRNVKVNDSTDIHLNIIRDGKPTTILLKLIENIELKELDTNQVAKYERFKSENLSETNRNKYESSQLIQSTKVEYPNLKLLPVSFVCFALGWDYFSTVSDINKAIDSYNKLKLDTGELESQRNRKTTIGVLFITAGIINAIISFQSVEIRVQTNSLSLSYNF